VRAMVIVVVLPLAQLLVEQVNVVTGERLARNPEPPADSGCCGPIFGLDEVRGLQEDRRHV
jgi:hypothetical protein